MLALSSCSDKGTNPQDNPPKEFPIVINELMASNQKTIKSPSGDYSDWVELFNKADSAVSLSGLYLSDKISSTRKWIFPAGTIIEPKSYLLVWCDDDSLGAGLHATFKLSKEGEGVFLFDNVSNGNSLLDSTTFSEQDTDVSWGRLPNGSGSFVKLPNPTPGFKNE